MSLPSRKSQKSPETLRTTSPIVCLCGSTRFKQTFEAENERLTLAGYIVLSAGVFPNAPANASSSASEKIGEEHKRVLDELHLEKILLSDEVRVLNVGGYIGESTRAEIEYARRLGKPCSYYDSYRIGATGASA